MSATRFVIARILVAAGLSLAAVGAAADSVLIRASGTTVATIEFEAAQPVVLDSRNGVVEARCAPHPIQANECKDLVNAGSAAPAFTLDATGATPVVRVDGTYAPGTRVTLAPSTLAAGYEFCARQFARAPSDSGTLDWTGMHLRTVAATPVLVTLSRPNTRYDFVLRCFGDAGGRSSTVVTMTTGN